MSREIIKVNLRINLPLDANNYVKSEMIVSKEFTIKSFEAKNSSSWKISCNPHCKFKFEEFAINFTKFC